MIAINNCGYNWVKTSILTENIPVQTKNTYRVKKGDNLTNIAKSHKTTVSELVRLNNIQNKNLIFVGQILNLPSKIIYFNKYTGNSTSIVDALKSIGEKSDYNYRVQIGRTNNILNYVGTSVQNQALLNLLKNGVLLKP